MTAKNDVTGDLIKSKTSNQNYQNNYDRIFGVKCKHCRFKQNLDKEPPVIICQSCGQPL